MFIKDNSFYKINGVSIADLSDKRICEYLINAKNSVEAISIFENIPISRLNTEICYELIKKSISAVDIIPENMMNLFLYSEALYYWGCSANVIKKHFSKSPYSLNELICSLISRHHNAGVLGSDVITTDVFKLLIIENDECDFLEGMNISNKLFDNEILTMLYEKYGKSFVKKISCIIDEKLYGDINEIITDLKLADFNYNNFDINLKNKIINDKPELIKDVYIYSITANNVKTILNHGDESLFPYIKKLNASQIDAQSAKIMKENNNFLITDIPNKYVTTEEYIKRFTEDDSVNQISEDKYNAKLAHLVIAKNINNLPYVPEKFVTQDEIKHYGLEALSITNKVISKIIWDEDYAIQFMKQRYNTYYNYIPKEVRTVNFYLADDEKMKRGIIFSGANDNEENLNKAHDIYLKQLNKNEIINSDGDMELYFNYLRSNSPSKSKYCSINKINVSKLVGIEERIKATYPEIFEELIAIHKYDFIVDDSDVNNVANSIINLLVMGINDNGTRRNFNGLDYALLTDISIDRMMIPICKALNIDAYPVDSIDPAIKEKRQYLQNILKLFGVFKSVYMKPASSQTKNFILKNGTLRDGKEIISTDEMNNIILFMVKNDVIINQKNYDDVVAQYLNKKIDINLTYEKKIYCNIEEKSKIMIDHLANEVFKMKFNDKNLNTGLVDNNSEHTNGISR